MNYNNLAQKTNWVGGTSAFPLVPFYLTSVNIPGINFNLPEVGGRNGVKTFLNPDTISFGSLNFEFLIDEDFEIYTAFYNHIVEFINVENGTFADKYFDFWIELNNSKNHKIMKFEFFNCRIESIGDIQLDTTDTSTENTLSVSLKFDYYKINKDIAPVQIV